MKTLEMMALASLLLPSLLCGCVALRPAAEPSGPSRIVLANDSHVLLSKADASFLNTLPPTEAYAAWMNASDGYGWVAWTHWHELAQEGALEPQVSEILRHGRMTNASLSEEEFSILMASILGAGQFAQMLTLWPDDSTESRSKLARIPITGYWQVKSMDPERYPVADWSHPLLLSHVRTQAQIAMRDPALLSHLGYDRQMVEHNMIAVGLDPAELGSPQ